MKVFTFFAETSNRESDKAGTILESPVTPHPHFVGTDVPGGPRGKMRNEKLLLVIPKPRISFGDADIPEGSPARSLLSFRLWQGNTVGEAISLPL